MREEEINDGGLKWRDGRESRRNYRREEATQFQRKLDAGEARLSLEVWGFVWSVWMGRRGGISSALVYQTAFPLGWLPNLPNVKNML